MLKQALIALAAFGAIAMSAPAEAHGDRVQTYVVIRHGTPGFYYHYYGYPGGGYYHPYYRPHAPRYRPYVYYYQPRYRYHYRPYDYYYDPYYRPHRRHWKKRHWRRYHDGW